MLDGLIKLFLSTIIKTGHDYLLLLFMLSFIIVPFTLHHAFFKKPRLFRTIIVFIILIFSTLWIMVMYPGKIDNFYLHTGLMTKALLIEIPNMFRVPTLWFLGVIALTIMYYIWRVFFDHMKKLKLKYAEEPSKQIY